MRVFTSFDQLSEAVGEDLGRTDWLEVTQERVDAFADATGDHQWIHVDVAKAKDGPFGGTIAHGYLTLSLGPMLTNRVVDVQGFSHGINYGLGRVRFPSPMPVGGRVRLRVALASIEDVPGGVQVTMEQTFEREGGDKPVCVAESLGRLYV